MTHVAMRDKAALDAWLAATKPGLIQLDDACLNGEADIAALSEAITPLGSLFVRCNGDVPRWVSEPDDWLLAVDGEIARPFQATIAQLRAMFEIHTITAVIECAGNGRGLITPAIEGLQWQRGAVGCARWTGFRLGDLLRYAGVSGIAVYAAFESPDRLLAKPDAPAFSRGLPLAKALADETLLAFAMNGEPLHALHGGPLRIVAPGFPGAAWQKWVSRIWVRDREHDGAKMTGNDYRIAGRVIEDMPVKSIITTPLEGFAIEPGEVVPVAGYAWSGHNPVASVEISGDGGHSWQPATLEAGEGPFAWRSFHGALRLSSTTTVEIVARATDRNGLSQPLTHATPNPKGYCNNTVHRVRPGAR